MRNWSGEEWIQFVFMIIIVMVVVNSFNSTFYILDCEAHRAALVEDKQGYLERISWLRNVLSDFGCGLADVFQGLGIFAILAGLSWIAFALLRGFRKNPCTFMAGLLQLGFVPYMLCFIVGVPAILTKIVWRMELSDDWWTAAVFAGIAFGIWFGPLTWKKLVMPMLNKIAGTKLPE